MNSPHKDSAVTEQIQVATNDKQKKIPRILSIDWDFFQDVSEDILASYPDGIDLSTELTDIVWGSKYAWDKRLHQIGIREEEYKALQGILVSLPKNTPIVIMNSHLGAYYLVMETLAETSAEKVDLLNVDMHHDIMNGNHEVDCGNWIGKLLKQKKLTENFRWIRNPISLEAYGFSLKEETEFSKLLSEIDGGISLKPYIGEHFDAVFLARSDSWSPPHLDHYFVDIVQDIISRFSNVKLEKCVSIPRKEYIQLQEKMADLYNSIRDSNNEIANISDILQASIYRKEKKHNEKI